MQQAFYYIRFHLRGRINNMFNISKLNSHYSIYQINLSSKSEFISRFNKFRKQKYIINILLLFRSARGHTTVVFRLESQTSMLRSRLRKENGVKMLQVLHGRISYSPMPSWNWAKLLERFPFNKKIWGAIIPGISMNSN